MDNKQKEWEYLPIWKALYPLAWTYLQLVIKYRNPLFFTNVNPTIETSGLFGESKIDILDKIPDIYKPKTLFLKESWSVETCLNKVNRHFSNFPLVAKPNIGERGFLVRIIKTEDELVQYLKQYKLDLVIQEFVELPRELAIMYYRIPGKKEGHITSVCMKRFLSVTGDGTSTVLELMQADNRATKQIERFKKEKASILDRTPANGECLVLENVGNHCKGTTFLDGSHLINPKMLAQFNNIGQQMEGVYYGRFDLKYNNLEELNAGKNIRIIEFNGVGAEPAHIYDPEIPIKQKLEDYKAHLHQIGLIHKIQKKRGVPTNSLGELYRIYQNYKQKTTLNNIPNRKTDEYVPMETP